MIQTDSSSTIVREIAIEAPAAAVFSALTEPDELTAWWGSDNAYRTTAMERDLRVGGAWNTSGVSSDGTSFRVSGVYRIIDPPHALEFTWRHDWGKRVDPIETYVRYDLDERDGVTHLRVTHWGFADAEERDDHGQGWLKVLDMLRPYAEKRARDSSLR